MNENKAVLKVMAMPLEHLRSTWRALEHFPSEEDARRGINWKSPWSGDITMEEWAMTVKSELEQREADLRKTAVVTWDELEVGCAVKVLVKETTNAHLNNKILIGTIAECYKSEQADKLIVKIDIKGVQYRLLPERDELLGILK